MRLNLETLSDASDPVEVLGHVDVDARDASLSAADAPAHDAGHVPHATPLAHQGTATVALHNE